MSTAEARTITATTTATATLTIPYPGPGVAVRVQSAHVRLTPSSVVTAFTATIRQRRAPDTWAELELGTRVRLWYLSMSAQLQTHMQRTGHLMLFPRQGREFFDLPVLDLVPGDAMPSPPPSSIGPIPAGHKVFTFPEIEGELFMIRLGLTPEARRKLDREAPVDPTWPTKYLFSIQNTDVTCFGPSYPDTVEIRFGTGAPAHVEPGTLLEPVQTPELGPALQTAVDQARAQKPTGAIVIPVAAATATPGKLKVTAMAEAEFLVTGFSDGKPTRELTFTESAHTGTVAFSLPAVGTPLQATVEVEGSLAQSVIMTELGREAPASGADVIGTRLHRNVTYLQKIEVDTPYEAVAVDARLAWARPDTLLVIEVRSADGVSRGELRLGATARLPGWATIALAAPLALDPKGSYEIAVWVERGEVTWLCGDGSEKLALRRDDSVSPVLPVVDVNGGAPMTGRLRVRARRPLDELPLTVELKPGAHPLAPATTEIRENGAFRMRLDLTAAVRAIQRGAVTLLFQSGSEGTIKVEQLRIAYGLHVEGSST